MSINMVAAINHLLYGSEYFAVGLLGVERGDAILGLKRIGHIGDDDPVAMTKKWQFILQNSLPAACSSISTLCTSRLL